mmetsp:Transcript_2969/g.5147  ORF Transcript_2969/g.5147 Transcript_2969/m.5147 type:complete len:206 (-) Transcript_2969:985-1602(-)
MQGYATPWRLGNWSQSSQGRRSNWSRSSHGSTATRANSGTGREHGTCWRNQKSWIKVLGLSAESTNLLRPRQSKCAEGSEVGSSASLRVRTLQTYVQASSSLFCKPELNVHASRGSEVFSALDWMLNAKVGRLATGFRQPPLCPQVRTSRIRGIGEHPALTASPNGFWPVALASNSLERGWVCPTGFVVVAAQADVALLPKVASP